MSGLNSQREAAERPIVSRQYEVDGEPRFRVHVFQPFAEDSGRVWRCCYKVDGPLTRHVGSQCGVDSVQALLNVLYVLSVEVEMSEENQTKRLTWDGQSEHFGFPPPEADPERKQRG